MLSIACAIAILVSLTAFGGDVKTPLSRWSNIHRCWNVVSKVAQIIVLHRNGLTYPWALVQCDDRGGSHNYPWPRSLPAQAQHSRQLDALELRQRGLAGALIRNDVRKISRNVKSRLSGDRFAWFVDVLGKILRCSCLFFTFCSKCLNGALPTAVQTLQTWK